MTIDGAINTDRTQDRGQHFAAGLDRALGPAVLLRLERVHLDRQLGRRHQVRQEHELPAARLGAVAEVEVLGQRVVLPAAGIDDGGAAPDPGGAVEVEEQAGAVAAAVLQHEVRVEQDRLDLGQQRVIGVDVAPPRLYHRDLGIDEERHRALQEVGARDEVGVEDRDVLTLGHLHARFERAGLVAGAVGAVQITDVDALGGIAPDRLLGHRARFVGGVVEHLDLEQLPRVIHLAHRVDQPVGHVHLVVDRQLHRDDREGVHRPGRHRLLILVLHVQVHQVVPVPAVHSQNNQDEEIGGERERFEWRHEARAGVRNTINDYMDVIAKVNENRPFTADNRLLALA